MADNKNLIDTKTYKEFKTFAFKENIFHLTVGIMLGTALNKIVSAFSQDLIMPFVNYFASTSGNWRQMHIDIAKNLTISIGDFLGTVVDFLIIALILFFLYKNIVSKFDKQIAQTKTCPLCFSIININATKCPNCTSML